MARIIPIWAYIVLAALLAVGVQQWRVSHYKAAAVSAKAETVAIKAANVANQATIKALQAANTEWASKCRADEPLARSEADKATAYASHQHVAVAKSIAAMKVTYEHEPTVKAWSDVVLPDAVVRVLTGASKD